MQYLIQNINFSGKRLSKYNITRDILTLNNSLLIECPDYTGSLLPNKLRESLNEVSFSSSLNYYLINFMLSLMKNKFV